MRGSLSTQDDDREWLVWHGAVLIVLAYAGMATFETWPWPMLAPLLVYAALLIAWPKWRATCAWLKVGSVSRVPVAVAVFMSMACVAALLIFQQRVQPDLLILRERVAPSRWPHPIMWAFVFSLLNATMEEAIFRGALFDALNVRLGMVGAILVSSILFGLGHIAGYPPGVLGVVLSASFACALAGLKVWTGGLLLPVAVHVCADATIAWVLLAS